MKCFKGRFLTVTLAVDGRSHCPPMTVTGGRIPFHSRGHLSGLACRYAIAEQRMLVELAYQLEHIHVSGHHEEPMAK
jgi:hypothetical protein